MTGLTRAQRAEAEDGSALGGATESVCPRCLARVPAERRLEGGDVYLVKECPEHGEFRTLVWRGEPSLDGWSRRRKPVSSAGTYAAGEPGGCPFDCGICAEHRQRSCTVLIEVTRRCNLACSFCFADSGEALSDPGLDAIGEWLWTAMEQSGPRVNLQLSGGEPTVRDDLAAIVTLAREASFQFIQLNTNGVRLADDSTYAGELKRAGLTSVFLQFDGTDDAIYRSLRGRPLLAEKLRAIEHCVSAGLGVILVPTLVPGVNTGNVGAILARALELAPGVRGVHFQPVSYFGRYPAPPADADRFTLPDLMRAIEEQTGGLMRTEDFGPPGCEHPYCSFHGNFLRLPDGGLEPLMSRDAGRAVGIAAVSPGADRAISFVMRQWAAPEQAACSCTSSDGSSNGFDAFAEKHRANTFAVSAMAFQDAWNLDLERLKDCCVHVLAPDGRLVPFCAYNLTSVNGETLYRGVSC